MNKTSKTEGMSAGEIASRALAAEWKKEAEDPDSFFYQCPLPDDPSTWPDPEETPRAEERGEEMKIEWKKVSDSLYIWEDGTYSAAVELKGDSTVAASLKKNDDIVWGERNYVLVEAKSQVEEAIRRTIGAEAAFNAAFSEATS